MGGLSTISGEPKDSHYAMTDCQPRLLIADDQPDVLEALRLLLKGANEEEEARDLEDFIFGLKFIAARVRNKTAEINFKFTDPEIALESWEGGGFDHDNFVKAVELTAKQFPGVERVSICVDGRKDYYGYQGGAKCPFPMFSQK